MFEQNIIEHHIQKSIMQVLIRKEYARYSDMRPEKIDSNLYAYHLNRLVSSGYIEKLDKGYTLSAQGLRYIEYTSSSMKIRSQPKITVAVLLKDFDGNILLTKRLKQPYINYYGLPLGKIHHDKDKNLLDSARRELFEKTGVNHKKLIHVGDMYLKIHTNKVLISNLLIHIFFGTCKQDIVINELSDWVAENDFCKIKLVPGVKEIAKSVDLEARFFKEISV